MNKQLYIKKSIYLLIALIGLYACDKMDDNIQPYLEDGEVLYTPRPIELEGKTGNARAQFTWNVTSNKNVKEWIVSYSDKAIVIANSDPEKNIKNYIVDGLEEGDFTFKVQSKSNSGNTSIAAELALSIYGETYRSALEPRALKSFSFDGTNAVINFKNSSLFTRNTEIQYVLQDGSSAALVVEPDTNEVELTNLDFSKDISYRTFYVPTQALEGEETSLDLFDSDWQPLQKPAVDPILNSVVITPILGGVKITWDNPDLLSIKVNVDYLDIEENNKVAQAISEAATGELIVSFMKAGEQDISISISDDANNALSNTLPVTPLDAVLLDRSGWTSPSQSTTQTDGRWLVEKMWDGDTGTAWHTPWGGASQYPHWFVLDLGAVKTISGFTFLPKWDDREVTKTKIEVSDDGTNWEEIGEYSRPASLIGQYVPDFFGLYPNLTTQYVRVTFLEGNGRDEAVIREFSLQGLE